MLALKVPLKHAQSIKKKLLAEELLDLNFISYKDKDHIFFPIKEKVDFGCEIVDKDFKRNEKKVKGLKDTLELYLNKDELSKLKTSYDLIGDIAILEIDSELRHKECLIAEKLLESNPVVNTVVRKADKHTGEFRVQSYKHLAGERKKETIHKENNVRIKLHIEKVYYSPRLSTERKRIAEKVGKKERILVLFAGCAPFPLVLNKLASPRMITSVELNPDGHRYALENVELNKMRNVEVIEQDAGKYIGKNDLDFDRILMPAPDNACDFIEKTLLKARKNTIIHYYTFSREEEFEKTKSDLKKLAESIGVCIDVFGLVKCGQHSPGVYRICVDLRKI